MITPYKLKKINYFGLKSTSLKVYREITPLSHSDVFVLSHYEHPTFDYPLHNHPEYELCLTINSRGNRIVGDSVAKYDENDLVLIGPYIDHRWDAADIPEEQRDQAFIIVVQFDKALFESSMMDKEAFFSIKRMLDRSRQAIHFTGSIVDEVTQRLLKIAQTEMSPFESTMEFLSILNSLATSRDQHLLASAGFSMEPKSMVGSRIGKVYDFIMKNYTKKILVTQAAEIANMSESAFSHFFKKCTNKSFTQFVVELRIGYACKLLMETQDTISQICFKCGFNNISNFNRLFKKYKKFTPLQYRQQIELALVENSLHQYRFQKI